jgi:hypothetical protein
MNRLLLIAFLVVISVSPTFAQSASNYTLVIEREMHYENLVYSFNLFGINSFMNDLEISNPVIHSRLQDPYSRLQTKSSIVNITGGSMIAVGLGFGVMAFRNGGGFSENWYEDTGTLSFIGFGFIGAGIAIISSLGVNENDVRNFINANNIINEIQIEVR